MANDQLLSGERLYLGVDIGGTKVAAGLVDSQGQIRFKTRTPMSPSGTAEEGLQAVRTAVEAVLIANPDARVNSIGVASPGPLDPRTGMVLNSPNLPCWRDYALVRNVEQACKLPVHLDNDANAAGLAEALWGAGRGYSSVFYATIGTGIGTGLALNGHVYHGRTGNALEGGHMTIDYKGPRCECGKRGCIEALAAGPAIAARARAKLQAGAKSLLTELAGGDIARVTGETVGTAFAQGDAVAKDVLRETADLLTVFFGNIVDVLEPDIIVVGGGVGELISQWFDHIRERLPQWAINQRCAEIPMALARYKADAGVAGAAALCMAEEKS